MTQTDDWEDILLKRIEEADKKLFNLGGKLKNSKGGTYGRMGKLSEQKSKDNNL
jgi:hypothetical protein